MAKGERPRLSVVALVHHDGKFLVGARRNGPSKGKFVLPGGGVEYGESLAWALTREVKEETGVEIIVEDMTVLDTVELLGKKSHRVMLIYAAKVSGDVELEDTEELKDVQFVDAHNLWQLYTDGKVQRWVVESLRRIGVIEDT